MTKREAEDYRWRVNKMQEAGILFEDVAKLRPFALGWNDIANVLIERH